MLIYLAEAARQLVLELLFDRLQPGGYLLPWHAESLLGYKGYFETVHLDVDVVYRRPERDGRLKGGDAHEREAEDSRPGGR